MDLEKILSSVNNDREETFRLISSEVNRLILEDFNSLVNILYRLDINEDKLRQALREKSNDAGDIIARMIMERQEQKAASRKLFKGGGSDEEQW